MTPDFWIVIPAYREAHRLPPYLRDLSRSLASAPFTVQIQVVDDGSPPADLAALKSALADSSLETPLLTPLKILPENSGKGAAIKAGWDLAPAATPWIVFLDADGAIPAYEVLRVLSTVFMNRTPTRAYFGSRQRMLGRHIERNLTRHLAGRVFATCVGVFINPHIYDSQCGFKCIPHATYRLFRFKLREPRFIFDVELLILLLAQGVSIEEIPVDWTDIPGGKVRLLRDVPSMLLGLVRIRLRHFHGAETGRAAK